MVLFTDGTPYSREAIVRDTANKEGGAHVAATLTPEFERLTTPGVIGDLVEISGGVETRTPIPDIHFVCIRQMAYELLNSPELLKLASYSPKPQSGGGGRSAGDERGEDAQGEPEVQDNAEAESKDEVHIEPEVQRPRPPGVKLTNEDLERLREGVIRYFRAYYSELRSIIEKQDLPAGTEYIRGYRHILFELGTDGAVITHRRKKQGDEDTFEFNIVKDTSVRELAAAKALKTPNGVTQSLHLDYNFGEDFGHNTYLGPLVEQEGDLYYHTDWVQLDYASWVHLDRWRDEADARKWAREDFQLRFGNGEEGGG